MIKIDNFSLSFNFFSNSLSASICENALGGVTLPWLIFLIGAMITVELIDAHGGFMFITNHITTKKKKKLLALIAVITFFMSAVLDNLTTSIIMIMLIRKLLGNYKERWVFGSIIIIAANSGGAWSTVIIAPIRNISVSAISPILSRT